MKFDTIIIGGGLTGMTAGIRLLQAGRSVAIVSQGQSALHFCSGSLELLGTTDRPLEAVESLAPTHPYQLIGRHELENLLEQVKPLMADAGLTLNGSHEKNSWRLTPLGYVKPAWLTLEDHVTLGTPDTLPWRKAAVVNVYGYIDFYPLYVARGLRRMGAECTTASFKLPQIERLLTSTTEMRSTNMARVLDDEAIHRMAEILNKLSADSEVVFMPAVLGLFDSAPVKLLRSLTDRPVYFIPTLPASVPGVRMQIALRRRFRELGGTYLLGDSVTHGDFGADDSLQRVYTANLGDMPLDADSFVLASGSFFSHGLRADIEHIYEPIFNLDVNMRGGRTQWYDKDLYNPQPYMSFGVDTDYNFHARRQGHTIGNLFCAGAVLSGVDSLREGSGGGVATTTALHVSNLIIKGL